MEAQPLSNGAAYLSVPEHYALPEHKRPGTSTSIKAEAIPVVDLGEADDGKIIEQIIAAGREFGFFQVVNHGVAEEVMGEMMIAAEEFFRLPTEEKMVHYSTDAKKLPRFHTSIGNDDEKILYWRDCLKLACHPVEQFRQEWPDKPGRLRAALEAYTAAARAVALRLLRLTAAGLGLEDGHFDGELSAGPVLMNVNHYVACPEPSLTLGLAPHCDPNVVTLLMDNGPLPGAFVANFGHQMEVVSNGAVRGGEHRVATSARAARTSVATFVLPEMGCRVAPAAALVRDGEPPLCRPYTYEEFVGVYTSVTGDRDAVLANLQMTPR
ncbi:hypothetical protein ACP4OV_000068 [Aristida adscensionis]